MYAFQMNALAWNKEWSSTTEYWPGHLPSLLAFLFALITFHIEQLSEMINPEMRLCMPLDMHNLSYVKIYLSDLKGPSWAKPHRKHMVPFLELAGRLLSPVRIIFWSVLISFNSTSSRPSSELPRHSNSTLIWPTMGPECYRLRGYNVCLPPVLLLWSAPGVYLLLAEKRQGSWSAQRAVSILEIYRVHIKVCSSSRGCQSRAWDTNCSVHDWIKLPSLNVQQLGKDSVQYPSK